MSSNLLYQLGIQILLVCMGTCFAREIETQAMADRPNILLIAVDDLNDWVGCLQGHPQVQTPNIDRLAKSGVLFTNAHCQAPVCNPSRSSLMSSKYPSTTGIYFLNPSLEKSTQIQTDRLMPQKFEAVGYRVSGAGKIFHATQNAKHLPNYAGSFGGFGPLPKDKLGPFPGHKLWDWGPYPDDEKNTPDSKIAEWAVNQIQQTKRGPWWLGIGFYRPHVPQYAPQAWFDLYPLSSVKLPLQDPEDLEDIPEYGIDITRLEHIAPTVEWVSDHAQQKPLVQSYLASVSFVDAQIGRVLNALQSSGEWDRTIVVLFSDHGFHLGEKQRYAKRSLWDDSTRVPLIISGPGIPNDRRCDAAVELIDIFPTLLDLAGIEKDPTHEGHSLKPLLSNPEMAWPHFARTTFGPGNHAITSKNFRYIHYGDGSEEFYDRRNDPHEWNNVVGDPNYSGFLASHRAALPVEHAEILGKNSTGHLSFAATEGKHKPDTQPPESNPPFQANGIKIGEVGTNRAIIWTRLTTTPEANWSGEAFPREKNRNSPPQPEWEIAKMKGAAPGYLGEVRLNYWSAQQPDKIESTAWQKVDPNQDFTHEFKINGLIPGSQYQVVSEARNLKGQICSRTNGSFRTAPPETMPADVAFSVVTGQEYHRRDDPEKGHKIYPRMHESGIDFFIHTGDIIYYDKPAPFADNVELGRFKWNRMYAQPFQREFHNQTSSYFIKDDHDTLKNDCWPEQSYGDLGWDQGLALFREQVPMGENTYRTFRWGKDLQIWLVEGRDYRSPNRMPDGPEKTIWGEEQKQWLFKSIQESDASFRIVISPTPIVGPDRGNKNDNHANAGFTHEGSEVRKFLSEQKNTYVICGDRHWQYVSVDPATRLREYSCGPTTNKHAGGFRKSDESPMHQYLNIKGGFLRVEVTRDTEGNPTAIFRHHDVDGNVLNEDRRGLSTKTP